MISILIGYLSYKFIEKPFRTRRVFNSLKIFYMSLITGVIIVVVGCTIFLEILLSPNDISQLKYTSLRDKIAQRGLVCEPELFQNALTKFTWCEFGDRNSTNSVILFGDSHAEAVSYELDNKLKLRNLKVYFYMKYYPTTTCVIFTYDILREGNEKILKEYN